MRQPDDFPDEALPEDDLSGEDLTGEDLSGEDLSGEDLPGEDLPGEDLPGEDLPGEDLSGEDLLEDEFGDAALASAPLGALTDDEPDEPALGEAEPDEEQLDEEAPGSEGSGAGSEEAIVAATAVLAGAVSSEITATVVVMNITAVSVTETSVTETSVTETSVTETSVTEVSAAALTVVENAWEPAPRPARPAWTRKAYADKLLAYSSAPSYADYVARSQELGQLLHSRYAETRLSPAAQQAANAFPETLNILALIAEEDPDTVAVLPIVARLVAAGPRLQLRVLSDEGDLFALSVLAPEFDQPTVLEEWDLPQFLLFDEEWELQAQWGPRPSAAEPQVEAWLAAHPEYETLAEDESAAGQERYAALTQRLMYEMRVWYNSSLAKSCLDEWQALLSAWQNGEDAVVEGEA